MKPYLALAVSLLLFLSFFYGAFLLLLMPNALVMAYQGVILMIPAALWWLVGLLKMARTQRWGWVVGFLVLLPLAPLVYDMHAARDSVG